MDTILGEEFSVRDVTHSLSYTDKINLGSDISTGKERVKCAYDYWKPYWGYRAFRVYREVKKHLFRLDFYSDDITVPRTIWIWSLNQNIIDGWRGLFSSRSLIIAEPYFEIRHYVRPYWWLLRISCNSIDVKLIMLLGYSFFYPYNRTLICYDYQGEPED